MIVISLHEPWSQRNETAAMLVFQNNETVAMLQLVSQSSPAGVERFLM